MSESRVTKSWIEATMAEADARYAAAYASQEVYRPQTRSAVPTPSENPVVVETPQAEPLFTPADSLPRPARRSGWRRALQRFTRASSFMIVGAGLMLALISFSDRPQVDRAEAPQSLQDPLAMLASLAPRFTSGEVVLEDAVALETLEGQLDVIREGAFTTLLGKTPGDDGFLTRVYGGVFTAPFEGSTLIGPPDVEPSLISFNRSQSSMFGGHLNGAYLTMRVVMSVRIPRHFRKDVRWRLRRYSAKSRPHFYYAAGESSNTAYVITRKSV